MKRPSVFASTFLHSHVVARTGDTVAMEQVVVVRQGVSSASRSAPVATGGCAKPSAPSGDPDPVPTGTPPSSSRKRKKKPYGGSSGTQTGQASNSKPDPSFKCEICAVQRTRKDLVRIAGCGHPCCNDCFTIYVASKLHDRVTRVGCPVSSCGGVLDPGYFSSILPREVFDRWCNALCEALILRAPRFYCPFIDCAALLIDDGGTVVRESECPNCRRLFCAQCRVPWHAGLECQKFQRLNGEEKRREDAKIELAPSSSSPKPKHKEKRCSGSLVTKADQPPKSKPDPSFICEICWNYGIM